jgi:hypothetical protein
MAKDDLVGPWKVVEMPDMMEDYLELTRNPKLVIKPPEDGLYQGDFQFGAQRGQLYGKLRDDLGPAKAFVFSFEGLDEGDEISGAAVMKLEGGRLVGEWMYHYGDVLRMICERC